MTTIRDIATEAGVSIGTVSNYLNDPQLVAEETRAKIQSKIKELGFDIWQFIENRNNVGKMGK